MNSIIKSDIILRDVTFIMLYGDILFFLFPFPQIVWRLGLLLLSVAVICTKRQRFKGLEKWMILFCVLNVIYYILGFLQPKTPEATHLGNTLCAMLPVSLFAYLSEKNVLTKKFISLMVVFLIIASIAYYMYSEQTLIEQLLLDDDADVTVNASTAFLMVLPLLFLEKKLWLWILELFVCIFFITSSVKRGNIVASIIPVLALFIYHYRFDKSGNKTRFFVLLLILIGFYMLSAYLLENNYFMYRMEQSIEGDSSNRDVIYKSAYHIWSDSSSILYLLFGHGWRAVTENLGTPAHSDWIEILVDNGIVGVFFYIMIFWSFVRLIKKTESSKEKFMLIAAFCIWGAKSVYSMAYVSNLMTVLMISIGYAIGQQKKKEIGFYS